MNMNGTPARKLLDEVLPLRDELRSTGQRRNGFLKRDLENLLFRAKQAPLSTEDPQLASFLEGVRSSVRRS